MVAEQESLFNLAAERLGDRKTCTRLYDGHREGVKLAGILPAENARKGELPLAEQLINVLATAHAQRKDLGSEVMDAMAARINQKTG